MTETTDTPTLHAVADENTVPYCAAHYRMPDDTTRCDECGRTKAQIVAETRAENAAAFVAGLRAFADWCEEHPEYAVLIAGHRFDLFLATKDELLAFKQASGATRHEKGAVADYFWLRRDFGGVVLDANVPREQACRKVVVGTREVPEEVVGAHTEEIIEWECDPLLANGDSDDEASVH